MRSAAASNPACVSSAVGCLAGSVLVIEGLEDLLWPVGLSPGLMAGYGSARGADVRRAALGIFDMLLVR
jgi:hypothetical protein